MRVFPRYTSDDYRIFTASLLRVDTTADAEHIINEAEKKHDVKEYVHRNTVKVKGAFISNLDPDDEKLIVQVIKRDMSPSKHVLSYSFYVLIEFLEAYQMGRKETS